MFCFGPMGFQIQKKEEKEEEKETEKKDEGVLKSCVKLILEGEEVKVNANIYSSHFILVIGVHDQLSSHSIDSKDITFCHVMSCHVMSCHVMSCHVMSCHVMSCHVMSCHVTLRYTIQCNNLTVCGNVHVCAGGDTEHTQWVAALTSYSSFLQDITQPTPSPSRLRG
jgi:hypothetical protein